MIENPDDINIIKKPLANIMRVLGSDLGSVLLVNFYFFITSIFVITIPLSALSLNRVIYELCLGNSVKVTKTYFSYFKTYFKDSLKLLAFTLPILALLCFAVYYYAAYQSDSALYAPLSIFVLIVLCFFIGYVTILTTVVCRVQLKFVDALKNAFSLFFSHIGKTILMTIIVDAALFATFYLLPYTIPVLPLFIFSLLSLISTSIFIYDIETEMVQ